jgi:arylmalonate decarboxylase
MLNGGKPMTISRREFLQVGTAVTLTAALGSAAENPLLGLVAPPANSPIPPEALAMYSSRVRFQTFGLGLKTLTPEGYDSVIDKIVPGAQTLAKAGANAVLIFGTSLTFYKGAAFNQKLIDDVKRATGLPTSSMSSAVVDGLRAMGGRRIAVATAYADEVNKRLRTFLGESGFEVLALKGLGLLAVGDPAKVSQTELQKFSASVFASAPKADALFISCGGLRTLEILAPLEKECNVPVVSSTPHALWAGVKLLKVSAKVEGYGKLLAKG